MKVSPVGRLSRAVRFLCPSAGRLWRAVLHDHLSCRGNSPIVLSGGCPAWDQAVVRRRLATESECGFTVGTWDVGAGLVQPSVETAGGFPWLAGVPARQPYCCSSPGSGGWVERGLQPPGADHKFFGVQCCSVAPAA